MPGAVQGPGRGRDLGVAPGLHAGKGPDRPGGVGGLLDGGNAGLQLLAVIVVGDEGKQQLGPVGEMKVQRLPGDADRAG